MLYNKKRYLPEFVYGSIDGVVTTFAIVAGSVGASLSSTIILILGFANLFADGFSMSVASFLSAKSQTDLHLKHRDYLKVKKQNKNPLKTGIVTFISFVIIGFIPLLSFVLAILIPSLKTNQFLYSFILTAIALLFVGAVKGFVVKKHPFQAALETLIIGGIASLLAYGVGFFLKGLLG